MKKRVLVLTLMLTMILGLVGCGSSSSDKGTTDTSSATTTDSSAADTSAADSSTADSSATAKDVKIGFVVKSLADQYWTLVKAGAQAKADELGVELTFIAPNAESDVATQVSMIEDLVAQEVDVICIAPSNDETVLPALQTAVDAGIKVIAVDTNSSLEELSSFIGTGNETAAQEGALWAGQQLEKGSTAIVLRGRLGDATHDDRSAGIEAGLKEAGVEVLTIEAADSTEEKGMSVTEDLLQKYPDVDLIITTADSMAVGAYNAVKAAGVETKIYGFDGTIPVCKLVDSGDILGTTAQSPYAMGELGVQNAVDLLSGKEIEARIDSGSEVITKENAADFVSDLEAKAKAAE